MGAQLILLRINLNLCSYNLLLKLTDVLLMLLLGDEVSCFEQELFSIQNKNDI